MTSSFSENWKFAKSYMPLIVDILRKNAMHIVRIEIATPDEDMKQSTDLKVTVAAGDVAVRVRRYNPQFCDKKYHDLTIRAYNNGHKTELDKLRAGFAQWYLYAWTDNQGGFDDWILVSIDKMREAGLLDNNRKVKMNKDNRTGFVAYSLSELTGIDALVAWK